MNNKCVKRKTFKSKQTMPQNQHKIDQRIQINQEDSLKYVSNHKEF